jgi:UDP-N-acetyl-D-galactosamine dehydrogenase
MTLLSKEQLDAASATPSIDGLIAVVGLGYVGLPLAVEFGKLRPVVGFDISSERIEALRLAHDHTNEVDSHDLNAAKHLRLSNSPSDLQSASIYIITVPTPIDRHKRPDLGPLLSASAEIGRFLSRGNIVIYESTVYPGATEEDCVPVLERTSGLKFNVDFFCGYSPERINPGDKTHRLPTVRKVTSGSTTLVAELIDSLYQSIIPAGTYKAESIKIAEAAKVIENTQRDLNIALVNEFAIIFNRLNLNTQSVLRAAGTKWNFLPFKPGLVGGHCIGVDPYYLTFKAEASGYHPQVILAGRRINDGMGEYIADQLIKAMLRKRIQISGCRILILGLTFKENCPDIRNTKVLDVIAQLLDYGASIEVFDPWITDPNAIDLGSASLVPYPSHNKYDGIVLAVAHDEFREMGLETIQSFGKPESIVYDVKSVFSNHPNVIQL